MLYHAGPVMTGLGSSLRRLSSGDPKPSQGSTAGTADSKPEGGSDAGDSEGPVSGELCSNNRTVVCDLKVILRLQKESQ